MKKLCAPTGCKVSLVGKARDLQSANRSIESCSSQTLFTSFQCPVGNERVVPYCFIALLPVVRAVKFAVLRSLRRIQRHTTVIPFTACCKMASFLT